MKKNKSPWYCEEIREVGPSGRLGNPRKVHFWNSGCLICK